MTASTKRPRATLSKQSRVRAPKQSRAVRSEQSLAKVSGIACACVLAVLLVFAGPWVSGGFAVQPITGARGTIARGQVDLDVPCFDQYAAGLPNGCEAAALTNVMNYYSFDLEPSYLADYWIPRSTTDWIYNYLGNPHDDSGHSIAAPGLVDAANAFLEANGSFLHAKELTGTPLEELFDYLQNGVPVIIYVTIDLHPMGEVYLEDPSGYFAPVNSHTVVLKGYDGARGEAYLSDSISGYSTCDINWLSHIYEQRGSQAVVIC